MTYDDLTAINFNASEPKDTKSEMKDLRPLPDDIDFQSTCGYLKAFEPVAKFLVDDRDFDQNLRISFQIMLVNMKSGKDSKEFRARLIV